MLPRMQAELIVPRQCKPDMIGILGEFLYGADVEGQEGLWTQLGGAALQREKS